MHWTEYDNSKEFLALRGNNFRCDLYRFRKSTHTSPWQS
jgi:hypothetical protein